MDALATPFGKRFLQWAFTILEEADTVRQKAVDAKSLLSGTLRIGVIPTVAPYLLSPVLASFLKLFPGSGARYPERRTRNACL